MLRLYPDRRAKASELVHHQWLEGIAVQGEIDLIRRAEEQEAVHRRNAQRQLTGADGECAIPKADVDALKPVEEDTGAGDAEEERAEDAPQPHQPPILSAPPAGSTSASRSAKP